LSKVAEAAPDIYSLTHEIPKIYRLPEHKEQQYLEQLEELLNEVFREDNGNVVDLLFDAPPITKIDYELFVKMCSTVANHHNKAIDWIEIRPSSTDKILQVQDYIASAVGSYHEHRENPKHNVHELMDIMSSRVKSK